MHAWSAYRLKYKAADFDQRKEKKKVTRHGSDLLTYLDYQRHRQNQLVLHRVYPQRFVGLPAHRASLGSLAQWMHGLDSER